jgi:hypothetical protein
MDPGRARDSSIAEGKRDSPVFDCFLRLTGESGAASPAALFFVVFFAALSICFDSFSSPNMAWMAGRGDFASVSELGALLELVLSRF